MEFGCKSGNYKEDCNCDDCINYRDFMDSYFTEQEYIINDYLNR